MPPTMCMEALVAPLPVASRETVLSMRVVRAVVEAVEQAGVSRAQLLRAARLDPRALDSEDGCVPSSEVCRLCELAVDITQDPALGLHWGERLAANTFNPVSHLVAHSTTLRQGLESLSKYHRLLSSQPNFQLVERGDKVTVRCLGMQDASPRMRRLQSEMFATGVFRMIRTVSPQARPDRVCFDYAVPTYHDEYARVFELTERFDQPFTGVIFDRALMDVASLHSDEDVHNALRMIADRRIVRLTQSVPFSMRVRDHLVKQGPTHRTSMKLVAHSLGLSTRSLRRRLVSEGKSYNAVVNEALATVAQQCLRDKQLTIQETAYEMGFADTSTFYRAFKRWTGMTPSAFRQK